MTNSTPPTERVLKALTSIDQPLTVSELTRLCEYSDSNNTTVRQVLRQLVADGRVTGRKETGPERAHRAGTDAVPASPPAMLYYAGPRVPLRTAPSLYDDLRPTFMGLPDDARERGYQMMKERRAQNTARVVEYVRSIPAGQPIIVGETVAALNIDTSVVRRTLNELVDSGELTIDTPPVRGRNTIFRRVESLPPVPPLSTTPLTSSEPVKVDAAPAPSVGEFADRLLAILGERQTEDVELCKSRIEQLTERVTTLTWENEKLRQKLEAAERNAREAETRAQNFLDDALEQVRRRSGLR